MRSPLDIVGQEIKKGGFTLVEASAGTGKTYSLASLYLRLLLETKLTVPRILVVTYTNAATDELVLRIREKLLQALRLLQCGEAAEEKDVTLRAICGGIAPASRAEAAEKLRLSLREFDQAAISTIHGFCQRTLGRNAFECGMPFDAEFIADDSQLLAQAARDFWRSQIAGNSTLAKLSVALGWSPGEFVRQYQEIKRQPDAELRPRPDPEKSMQALLSARDGFISAWRKLRPSLGEGEISWDWLERWSWSIKDGEVKSSLKRCLAQHVRNLDAFAAHEEWTLAVEPLKLLNLEDLAGQTKGDSPDLMLAGDKPEVIARAEALGAALAQLAHGLRYAFVEAVALAVAKEKERLRVLGFDDLLTQLRRSLENAELGAAVARAVGREYGAALIDEFQDTDPAQYEIFHRIFDKSGVPVFFVGDPKQAIYSFRGADIFTYMRAAAATGSQLSISTNHRSGQGMVAAVNALFGQASRPFVHDSQIPFTPVAHSKENVLEDAPGRGWLHWWLVEMSPAKGKKSVSKERALERVCAEVAAEIVRLLNNAKLPGEGGMRSVRPSDIAVLVRTNPQAAEIQKALRLVNVPSVAGGKDSVFETRESAELAQLLEAVLSPGDEAALRAALATECWGYGAEDILALAAAPQRQEELHRRLALCHEDWRKHGFMAMFERFLAAEGVKPRLLAMEDGERRLTNLRHLAELLHQAARDEGLSPQGLLGWLKAGGSGDREQAELRLESDEEAVRIVTIHKSKGLQYGIAFCPFLWNTHEPKRGPLRYHEAGSAGAHLVVDYREEPGDDATLPAVAEALAEELRLAYVALTRSRHRCYVAWGGINGAERSALAYLLCQPADDRSLNDAAWARSALGNAAAILKAGKGGERLAALVEQHKELMGLSVLADDMPPAAQWHQRQAGVKNLQARPLPENLPGQFHLSQQTASYSSLHGHALPAQPETDAERGGRDEAAIAASQLLPEALGGTAAAIEAQEVDDIRLGGKRFGVCLHAILQYMDFRKPESAATAALIRGQLIRHGFDAEGGEAEKIGRMLARLMQAKLPGAGFSLSEVAPEKRFNEMRFWLPAGRFLPGQLARLFRERGSFAVAGAGCGFDLRARYANALANLDRRDIDGYLVGSIDVAFEHGGRWYIVDWKSDRLGDYSPSALARRVCDSHYALQYHLYSIALGRYLQHRLGAAWSYESFGGAYYAFTRGAGSLGGGIYYDRPPQGLLDGMGDLLAREVRP